MIANALPLQLTQFIGREGEIATVERLLSAESGQRRARLLTLTGVGGCGKTRLAIEVAQRLRRTQVSASASTSGVSFVELAALGNPELLAQTVASAIGLRETSALDTVSQLALALGAGGQLLVLDNCEHLAAACAQLVTTLLAGCPDLVILATSRAPLKVAGEVLLNLPPLQTVDVADNSTVEDLAQSEAYRLFADRARAYGVTFDHSLDNAGAVGQICRQLDGLPLAIELAAAQVRVMTPRQIVRRLDELFNLARLPRQMLAPHHLSLYTTFEWSHDLLDAAERRLLRRLAVFAGGWTLGAAEAVADDQEMRTTGVIELHARLIDQSLIARVDDGSGERAYFRMLEPVRQFATRKLIAAGEEDDVRRRHLRWCVTLVEEAEFEMLHAQQAAWLARMDRELLNVRSALAYAIEVEAWELGLRIASGLWPLWEMRGYLSEGRGWLEVLQPPAPPVDGADATDLTHAKMKTSLTAGLLEWQMGNHEPARTFLEGAIRLAQALEAPWYHAYALCRLGRVLRYGGDLEGAQRRFEASLALFRASGDSWGLSRPLRDLGLLARQRGDFDAASAYLQEALRLRRMNDDADGIADALRCLGHLSRSRGDYDHAAACYAEARAIYTVVGYTQGVAASDKHLGFIALDRGQMQKAWALFGACARLSTRIGALPDAMDALTGLQQICVVEGELQHAARLEGMMVSLAGVAEQAVNADYRDLHARSVTAAREGLGADRFAAREIEGLALSVDDALALGPPLHGAGQAANTFGLTPRELEVLRLLAQGLSNQEIADRLVVSRRTVHAHIRAIFGKLDVNTRTAAAHQARQLGLI